jgi:transposase-like protein
MKVKGRQDVKNVGLGERIMTAQADADKPWTIKDVADAFGVSPQAIYYAVRKLISAKRVRRVSGGTQDEAGRFMVTVPRWRETTKLTRYVPTFRPRVFDAAQCPMARADLCMIVRG